MKLYIVFAIVTICNYAPTHGAKPKAKPSNKVKVTGYETTYVDDQYFDPLRSQTELHQINKTYTRLSVHLEELKDIPSDVQFDIKVRRSKTQNADWQQVGEYTIHPCDKNDKYRQYLSNFIVSLTDGGNCFQKGSYSTDDSGIFRYYDILPAKDIDGYYFTTMMTLELSDKPLQLYVVRSQSINVK